MELGSRGRGSKEQGGWGEKMLRCVEKKTRRPQWVLWMVVDVAASKKKIRCNERKYSGRGDKSSRLQ